jgi:hypothetical protein
VLYAPRNISGQSTEYAEAIRGLGAHAEVWSYGEPAFGFACDFVADQERLLVDPGYRWHVFDRAVRHFDVFHLQYGRSLLNPEGVVLPDLWDVPLLKSLGKRVFMHWRGSDLRLKSMHVIREPESYFRTSDVPCDEPRILGKLSIARRFCDGMFVSTPGLLDYAPDAVWIPHAIDVDQWRTQRGAEPDVPVVVHLPSSRATKGSDAVDIAVQPLAAAGRCHYLRPAASGRQELMRILQKADIVVDSLSIGDHGLISVEAMAAGAIAVGHVHEKNRERNPGVPVVEATGETLNSVISALIDDPARRHELRTRGLTWARERHDRAGVGRLLLDAYKLPMSRPSLSYPHWPRSDGQRRILELEREVESLRQQIDPLLQGLAPHLSSTPRYAVARFLARIEELEAALRAVDPGSRVLQTEGRRKLAPRRSDWRHVVRSNPEVHRVARRIAKRWRR